jgi:hypothetical protein
MSLLWYFCFMSSPEEFPPKGFHIVRGVDTPFGPMDTLEENEGYRLHIPLADMVEVEAEAETETEPQDPVAEI